MPTPIPKRKISAKAKVPAPPRLDEIQIMSEHRLLDSKIVNRRKISFVTVMAITGLGFIFAALASWYFLFFMAPVQKTNVPKIVIVPIASLDKQPTAAPAPPSQKVLIGNTPTGLLNVRSGPGPSYSKIAEAKPGETYAFIGENSEKTWFEIYLTKSQKGWVTKKYATLK